MAERVCIVCRVKGHAAHDLDAHERAVVARENHDHLAIFERRPCCPFLIVRPVVERYVGKR